MLQHLANFHGQVSIGLTSLKGQTPSTVVTSASYVSISYLDLDKVKVLPWVPSRRAVFGACWCLKRSVARFSASLSLDYSRELRKQKAKEV